LTVDRCPLAWRRPSSARAARRSGFDRQREVDARDLEAAAVIAHVLAAPLARRGGVTALDGSRAA